MPGWLSGWNRIGSPRPAFCFHITMAIITLLILNLTTISNISALEDLTKWIQGSFVTSLLLFIRISRLEVNGNIVRVNILLPCLYLTCLLALICSTLLTKWVQILLSVGVFGLPLVIYLILVRPTGLRRLNECEQMFDSLGGVSN